MIKHLRFIFLSLAAMLVAGTSAQTVFDFDNNGMQLLGLAGESSGSGSTAVTDGDITETKTATIGDITVAISPKDEGTNTENRLWNKSPKLRLYSGTLTVTSAGQEPISMILFQLATSTSAAKWNANNTVNTGEVDNSDQTIAIWMGSAQEVVFTIGGNTQISSITVVCGEVNPGDDDEGYSLEYLNGTLTETDNQIVYDFNAIEDNEAETPVTGKMVFDFTEDACTKAVITYNFPSEELAQEAYALMLEDEENEFADLTISGATITGDATNYFSGFTKAMIRLFIKILMDEDEGIGEGTLSNPYSPAEANLMGKMMLDEGETADFDVFVKGKISAITYTFDTQHGTATYYISEDGTTNADQFLCYGTYYLENKSWVEGYKQIQLGDEVIVYGKLTNYKGTIETASRKAYIYSLNGQTEAEGSTPEPQVKVISVSEAVTIINALEDGATTSEAYQVKGYVIGTPDFQRRNDGTLYGNVNFDMADDQQGGQDVLTVFRAKDFNGESFTEETINRFEDGDVVVVEGYLQKYIKNGEAVPELVSGKLVSVNGVGDGIVSVTTDRQLNGRVYNMQGQRVAQPTTSGLYIIDGRKVIVK